MQLPPGCLLFPDKYAYIVLWDRTDQFSQVNGSEVEKLRCWSLCGEKRNWKTSCKCMSVCRLDVCVSLEENIRISTSALRSMSIYIFQGLLLNKIWGEIQPFSPLILAQFSSLLHSPSCMAFVRTVLMIPSIAFLATSPPLFSSRKAGWI